MADAFQKSAIPFVVVSCKNDSMLRSGNPDPSMVEQTKRVLRAVNVHQTAASSPESQKRCISIVLRSILTRTSGESHACDYFDLVIFLNTRPTCPGILSLFLFYFLFFYFIWNNYFTFFFQRLSLSSRGVYLQPLLSPVPATLWCGGYTSSSSQSPCVCVCVSLNSYTTTISSISILPLYCTSFFSPPDCLRRFHMTAKTLNPFGSAALFSIPAPRRFD